MQIAPQNLTRSAPRELQPRSSQVIHQKGLLMSSSYCHTLTLITPAPLLLYRWAPKRKKDPARRNPHVSPLDPLIRAQRSSKVICAKCFAATRDISVYNSYVPLILLPRPPGFGDSGFRVDGFHTPSALPYNYYCWLGRLLSPSKFKIP